MSIINSTTGHNAKGERKTAGIIYLIVGIVVSIAIVLFFVLGTGKTLRLNKTEDPTKSAPDSTPGGQTSPPITVPPADNK